jgi:hypothetical protein
MRLQLFRLIAPIALSLSTSQSITITLIRGLIALQMVSTPMLMQLLMPFTTTTTSCICHLDELLAIDR